MRSHELDRKECSLAFLLLLSTEVLLGKLIDSSRNSSGARGVSWHKNSKTWVAFWNVDRKLQTKAFSPSKKYPNLEYDTAKQMAFKDAVEYRNKMIELHYGQSSQIGEIP